MRDYPFSFEQLNDFSIKLPYGLQLKAEEQSLFTQLEKQKVALNFPAIRNDIGLFLNFLIKKNHSTTFFEFGSGYGQSALWYLLNNPLAQKIILTEKRDDLVNVFEGLPWPAEWKQKITYYQQDAFKVFEQFEMFDFILIDGVKADYLDFLKLCETKISLNGIVAIDNSYWRGSFLSPQQVASKQSAARIKELHDYIRASNFWESIFIPFEDGLTLLTPKTI